MVEPAGNATFQFRHKSFQQSLFCSAIERREADTFWSSDEVAIENIDNPELQNVFKIGGGACGDPAGDAM